MKIDAFISKHSEMQVNAINLPFPGDSVLYFIVDAGDEIIYIGSTINFTQRMTCHQSRQEFYQARVFYAPCQRENLLRVEAELINTFKPKYNKTFKIYPPGYASEKAKGHKKIDSQKCSEIKRKIKEIAHKKNISYADIAKRFKVTRQSIYPLLQEAGGNQKNVYEKLEKILIWVSKP